MKEPRASRPAGFGASPDGLLPWAWAEERLAESHNYWLSTVSEDGQPHAMAVWALWHDGGLWFSTGEGTRKARNLLRDARCIMTTERADEAVILEGTATLVADVPPEVPAQYLAKYGMGYPPSAVFVVRPHTAFGFIEDATRFAATATRWHFDP